MMVIGFSTQEQFEEHLHRMKTTEGDVDEIENMRRQIGVLQTAFGELIEEREIKNAQIAKLRAAQEWQDISTAPKDGGQVLLWSEAWEMSWGVQIGTFGDGKWHCGEGSIAEGEMEFDGDDPYPIGPTHWMPLPEPHVAVIAEERTDG